MCLEELEMISMRLIKIMQGMYDVNRYFSNWMTVAAEEVMTKNYLKRLRLNVRKCAFRNTVVDD